MSLLLKDVTKKQFDGLFFENDYAIAFECENCGAYTDATRVDDVDDPECPDCGADADMMIPDTSHEGMYCDFCHGFIDIWTDAFVHDIPGGDSNLMCQQCFDELEVLMQEK